MRAKRIYVGHRLLGCDPAWLYGHRGLFHVQEILEGASDGRR